MNVTVLVLFGVLAAVSLVVVTVVSAAETAFTRLTRTRADAIAAAADDPDADDGTDDRLEVLRMLSRRPASTVAPLVLATLIGQVGAGWAGWEIGDELAGRDGSLAGVGVAAALVVVATVAGRSRALAAPDASAVGLVPILRLVAPLGALTSGVVRLVFRTLPSAGSNPEIDERELLALVEETSAIDPGEEALIKRVVAFDDQTVGAIATPRTDVIMLRSGFAVRDALQVAALHGLSRIPVTTSVDATDDIIGAVHVKDLIQAQIDDKGAADIDLWLREVAVVPEAQRAATLLGDLKTSDMHLAIVVDEHGGVAGVVTLEDVLEELVGEIEDEFDVPEPAVQVIDERTIRVDGKCEIPRVEEILGIELVGDFRTIAGCVFSGLGRVPEVGDVLVIDASNLELEVLRMHGRRIADVEVRTAAPVSVPVPASSRVDS